MRPKSRFDRCENIFGRVAQVSVTDRVNRVLPSLRHCYPNTFNSHTLLTSNLQTTYLVLPTRPQGAGQRSTKTGSLAGRKSIDVKVESHGSSYRLLLTRWVLGGMRRTSWCKA
mmetsp:Transcript_2442/g.4876  ORF Transcript_2442/g.4876 Transcript_2442/m.4876 type:complete len:113 (-) Transcript_2442:2143-2481(-)